MAILKERGYRALTLRDLPDELAADGPPPSDARVAITFDDGYRSVYEYAWPMLREAGFPATVYLPTDSIAAQRRRIHGIECLTWDEAAAMAAAGIEFGSHTVRHAPLADEPESAVQTELADSKAAIEEHLGRPVETFSYPYAFPEAARAFRSRLRDLLTRAGYRTAVTTLVGTVRPGDDLLCLKRLPVNTWDDDALFLAKLQGGYDWMHALQRAHKRLRRLKPGARPQARRAPAGAE
jgi:peptidoglycan/xylan/chitin deacetylase (PgdA/CDA1 family)